MTKRGLNRDRQRETERMGQSGQVKGHKVATFLVCLQWDTGVRSTDGDGSGQARCKVHTKQVSKYFFLPASHCLFCFCVKVPLPSQPL